MKQVIDAKVFCSNSFSTLRRNIEEGYKEGFVIKHIIKEQKQSSFSETIIVMEKYLTS